MEWSVCHGNANEKEGGDRKVGMAYWMLAVTIAQLQMGRLKVWRLLALVLVG